MLGRKTSRGSNWVSTRPSLRLAGSPERALLDLNGRRSPRWRAACWPLTTRTCSNNADARQVETHVTQERHVPGAVR